MSDPGDATSIALFKKHFKYDPEQALNKIHLVAFDLGPEACRSKLVPLLFEYQTNGDDFSKYNIAIAWKTVSKFVGGGSHFRPILLALEHILSQEEPFVREQGIETFLEIIHDNKNFTCPTIQISLINDTVCPMLERLANDDWFAAPSSACCLIPKIYPLASPQNQANLLQSYHRMCETPFVLVKLAASRNLKDLFIHIDIEDAISLFWLALKNIADDTQDQVRIEALESCLSFAKRCTDKQNESFNVPIIRAAMQDLSWKVRKKSASLLKQIYSILGASIVDSQLSGYICQLMNDKVEWVKTQAIESFVECVSILEYDSICLYKAQIKMLPTDSNPDNRKHAVSILSIIAQNQVIDEEFVKSILSILIKDTHHTIKLALLNSVNLFQKELAIEENVIHKFLIELKTSTAWRVRLSLIGEIEKLVKKNIINYNFSDIIMELLLDHVYKVRITMIEALERLKDDPNWDVMALFNNLCTAFETKTLPPVAQEVYGYQGSLNYKLRITIINALKVLYVKDISRAIKILKLATDDPVINVKIAAKQVLKIIYSETSGKMIQDIADEELNEMFKILKVNSEEDKIDEFISSLPEIENQKPTDQEPKDSF